MSPTNRQPSAKMHPGYSANIDLTCDEGELDRNPAFKALFNAIEDAINIYLDSGPKSVQEINIAVGPHDVITQLFPREPCPSTTSPPSTLQRTMSLGSAELLSSLSTPSTNWSLNTVAASASS